MPDVAFRIDDSSFSIKGILVLLVVQFFNKEIFKTIKDRYGSLDVLINNAGIASMNHSLTTPLKTVEKIFNTNLIGTMLCSKEAVKIMQPQGFGRIVNFSSIATSLNYEGEAIYAASKSGIVSFTNSLAKEVAKYGITVNAVGPTALKTDLNKAVSSKKLDLSLEYQAIKRYGEFKDISNVIDFFILKDSDFVTGQTLYLGGI